jgi:hypothetical protein
MTTDHNSSSDSSSGSSYDSSSSSSSSSDSSDDSTHGEEENSDDSVMDKVAESNKPHVAFAPAVATARKTNKGDDDSSEEEDKNAIDNVAESVMEKATTSAFFVPVTVSHKKTKQDDLSNDSNAAEAKPASGTNDSSDEEMHKMSGNVADSVTELDTMRVANDADEVKPVEGSEADALRVNPYPKIPPDLTSDEQYECREPKIVNSCCSLIFATWPMLKTEFCK